MGNNLIRYRLVRKSNSWGVVGKGLTPGMVVTVYKSNGQTETETVADLVFTYKNGAQLFETVRKGRGMRSRRGAVTGSHYFTGGQQSYGTIEDLYEA